MKKRKIISPIASGSGAYILHKSLEQGIQGYNVLDYSRYWEYFPFAMPMFLPLKNPDLIHTTPDYGIFFLRKNVPMVVTFHGYRLDTWIRHFSSFFQKIHYSADLRLWTRLSCYVADRITAVSRFIANIVKKDLHITKPLNVIYNGVNEKLFAPNKTLNISDKKVRVFFSGNLDLKKGAHWLPHIAKRLSSNIEIQFTQGLRKKGFIEVEKNLVPIGPIPYENMPGRYQHMDVLLMPTIREGFSLAILEAMSCGLPVVASDCSSLPEQIDEGKGGFLCPIGDVDSFAEKINILADSPNLRKEMGEYNRDKVEKMFTLDRMVKEYRELFDEVLDKGGKGSER